jgi:FKBP-type peptidyl-prolyl cis-trans isomerase
MRTRLVLLSILVVSGTFACASPESRPLTPSEQDALAAPADVAAPPADATKTPSGLAYRVLRPGTGTQHPTASDTVRVNYTGWTPDGQMFDSSIPNGAPISFPLDRVIRGWTEGVQLMVVGEKTRFWIPGALAYGDVPREGVPTGPLVFDVELLAIE